MRINFAVESPPGTELDEWTLIVDGCDTGRILYNGPTRVGGLSDGRINRFDLAAPVAVYPFTFEGGVGLRFYQIDAGGHGTLILEVTPEQIAAVANPPASNTLIASTPGGAVALYRLTTGEFQVNAGSYVIVFSELDSGAAYYTPAG